MKKKCSIIIRTKNEERWISLCLESIFMQNYKNYEIIIVDNNSIDQTIEKAKNYGVKKILNIGNYLPGKALNLGIKKSSGEYIVCLSAHCIATNKNWLRNLVNTLEEDESYAGVYGRQEPMAFSSMSDKRDMMIVFGLDKKIQIKDSFFHNANSILKKKICQLISFNEKTTNIEDRIWAKMVLKKSLKIVYEPKASVYHYHGIHQGGNYERLKDVVKIIEKDEKFVRGKIDPKKNEYCSNNSCKGQKYKNQK